MSHKETEWEPKGGAETFKGFDVHDHGVFPHEVNDGEVDGEVSFDEE